MKVSLVFSSFALILQIYKFYRLYFGRRRYRFIEELLRKLQPLTPTAIVEKLSKSSIGSSFQLCVGKVFASEPLFAFLKPKRNVLNSHLIDESYSGYKSAHRVVINKREPSFYIIKDNANTINLYEGHKMVSLHTNVIKNYKKSMTSKILRLMLRSKKAPERSHPLSQLLDGESLLESFMLQGGEYAVLAKFKKQSGEICSYQPMILSKSPNAMSIYVEKVLLKNMLFLFGLLIGIALCLGIISYQLWKHYRRNRVKNIQYLINSVKQIFVKKRVCSLCRKNLSCILNRPCNHMTTCQSCSRLEGSCLECKQEIIRRVEYFVS